MFPESSLAKMIASAQRQVTIPVPRSALPAALPYAPLPAPARASPESRRLPG